MLWRTEEIGQSNPTHVIYRLGLCMPCGYMNATTFSGLHSLQPQ